MAVGQGQLIWHYTVLPKVKLIQRNLVLMPFGKPGLPGAVWFSTEQDWEPTAACNWQAVMADGTKQYLDRDGLYKALGGLYRFGVLPDTAPLTWEEFSEELSEEVVKAMLDGAKELGADPATWRATKIAVPQDKWVIVQMWDGRKETWENLGKKA